LIRYTHACVRLEDGDRTLVIDPGVWAEPESLDGVSDVLVTHEHSDHLDVDRLVAARAANPALTVYAGAAVADELSALGDGVVTVSVGDRFTAAGFEVQAVGGEHAEIYEGLPGCANLGYIVDGGLYHPGDARPRRAYPIHDATLSEIGQSHFDGWVGAKGNTDYARIPVAESVSL
jgi:L-ascorbate metabolism protein UlaG (beta-lactamase superfamily)